jgi:hypothetical protein
MFIVVSISIEKTYAERFTFGATHIMFTRCTQIRFLCWSHHGGRITECISFWIAPIFISVSYDFLLIRISILFSLFYPTRLYGLMDSRFYMIPRTFRLFKCPFFVAVWSLFLLWSSFSYVCIKLTRLCYEFTFARIISRSTSSEFIRVALMYHGSRF